MADAFVDLHSGGSALNIIPSAIVEPSDDAALAGKIHAAVAAFDAPMTAVIANRGDPRTSTSSAVRAGLITVGTELGDAGTVSPDAVKVCRNGLENLLRHFGIPEGNPTKDSSAARACFELGPKAHHMTEDHGVFEPLHTWGADVRAGLPAGRVHFLADPRRASNHRLGMRWFHLWRAAPRPGDQAEPSVYQRPGRADEPHDQGGDSEAIPLRQPRSVANTSWRLHGCLQLRPQTQDSRRSHALRMHL